MKLGAECIPCLFERAKFECDLVLGNSGGAKLEVLSEVAKEIGKRIGPESVPAALGTLRERIIRNRSGSHDPYRELKDASNAVAQKLLPVAINFYEGCENKIEALMKIAAAANSMEYGVKGYDYHHDSFAREFRRILKEDLLCDGGIRGAINGFTKVLYLTDNAGEIIFDEFIAEKLVENGIEVIASPKSEPVINDATAEDIARHHLFKGFRIVPSGSSVGLSLEEAPREFLELLWDESRLIIAKGMGYYETLSEFEDRLKGRLIYALRAKCDPVARSIGAPRGALVARLV